MPYYDQHCHLLLKPTDGTTHSQHLHTIYKTVQPGQVNGEKHTHLYLKQPEARTGSKQEGKHTEQKRKTNKQKVGQKEARQGGKLKGNRHASCMASFQTHKPRTSTTGEKHGFGLPWSLEALATMHAS